MGYRKITLFVIGILCVSLLPAAAGAHEAYVLPHSFFWEQVGGPYSFDAFGALRNAEDIAIVLKITGAICALIITNFLFRLSPLGAALHRTIERLAPLGPIFVRLAVAGALFFGATSDAFLGPELPLSQLPFALALRILLYLASILILLGFYTEIGAIIGLLAFAIATISFGDYTVTYLNYFGEFIVLALFGMRYLSFDKLLFGPLKGWRAHWEVYETTVVRIAYGIALIYAGLNVKILHPDLSLRVVNDWNLTQFHWLFPHDPVLLVLGAGLAEIVIGIFLLIGFEVRMTVLISLFYITLSLLYFGEAVWPHLLLYGISLSLLVQPEILTLDHFLFGYHRNEKSIWKRLVSSHRPRPAHS